MKDSGWVRRRGEGGIMKGRERLIERLRGEKIGCVLGTGARPVCLVLAATAAAVARAFGLFHAGALPVLLTRRPSLAFPPSGPSLLTAAVVRALLDSARFVVDARRRLSTSANTLSALHSSMVSPAFLKEAPRGRAAEVWAPRQTGRQEEGG
jgi:hypothetical protein